MSVVLNMRVCLSMYSPRYIGTAAFSSLCLFFSLDSVYMSLSSLRGPESMPEINNEGL